MEDSFVPVALGARHQFENRAIVSASAVSRAIEIAGFIADQRSLGKGSIRSAGKRMKRLLGPHSIRARHKFKYVIRSPIKLARTVEKQTPDWVCSTSAARKVIDDFFRPGAIRLWRQAEDYAVVMRTAAACNAIQHA